MLFLQIFQIESLQTRIGIVPIESLKDFLIRDACLLGIKAFNLIKICSKESLAIKVNKGPSHYLRI